MQIGLSASATFINDVALGKTIKTVGFGGVVRTISGEQVREGIA